MREVILGIVVGISNLLPGISGGTILFISGRYAQVIRALGDLFSLKVERKDLILLLKIGIGVLIAALGLSKFMDYLFQNFPKEVTSFFSGLIIGGLFFMYPRMGKINLKRSIAISLGIFLMAAVYYSSEGNLNPTPLALILGGALAGGTMILPGVSGSSMLVILGLYDDAIHALSNMDIIKLLFLGAGAAAGVIGVSILLKELVKKFEKETMAFLYGLTLAGLIFIVTGGVSVSFVIFGLGTTFLLERVVGE